MEPLTRRTVVLVGLPGSGKTTVGALVARRLGATFTDLDQVVEARAGKSISRIFAEDGEPAFRTLESRAGAELLSGVPGVLAPGGGFLLDERNRRLALEKALLVYLDTSPSVAARRLEGQDDRPLLKGFQPVLRLHQLLEQRRESYLQAQGRVTTDDRTPEEVAHAVTELARKQGGW
jgi:shikimate kinase